MSIRNISNKIKDNAFGDNSPDGFLLDKVRDTYIEARYIEKLQFSESVVDPFGAESLFQRVEFKIVEFKLSKSFPQVEIRNPPRSLQSFISRLLEVFDFSISITSLSLNINEWINSIQSKLNEKIVVDCLQINKFEPEKGIQAKISITGVKDVRKSIKRITGDLPYVLEKVQMKVQFEGRSGVVILSANGNAKISDESFTILLPIIRDSIPQ